MLTHLVGKVVFLRCGSHRVLAILIIKHTMQMSDMSDPIITSQPLLSPVHTYLYH